ncbi:MAG: hypothetical protein IK096_00420 [Lachnospiraceae bacterium]|nr:hypothetical protein [Lachnospiraceae bacterium]
MNRKLKRRFDPVIDLTALLDVVFIVLLIVICNQQSRTIGAEDALQQKTAAAEEMLTEAKASAAEADAAKAMYQDRLDSVEQMQELVTALTVEADYTPGNPSVRHFRLLGLSDEEISVTELTPDTEQEAYGTFSADLTERVEAADGKPVILSLQFDHILYRDEEALRHLLTGLGEDHDNVYYK